MPSCRSRRGRSPPRNPQNRGRAGRSGREPEPAPLDVAVHHRAGNGLERRHFAGRGTAIRAKTRVAGQLLAAARTRAVPDRGCAHVLLVPHLPAPVTPPQPACGAAPPGRGSRCPTPCPSGGRIRAPSAPQARDRAPPPEPGGAVPRARARRAGRSRARIAEERPRDEDDRDDREHRRERQRPLHLRARPGRRPRRTAPRAVAARPRPATSRSAPRRRRGSRPPR